MLTLHPRLVARAVEAEDHHYESCACYSIVVSCVSLLLFIVLAAAVSVSRACAITGAAVLLLGLVAWLVPTPTWHDGATTPPAAAVPGVRLVMQQHRCACGLADAAIAALPTFAYEPPSDGSGDDDKPPQKRGSCVLCAVCLEDVRAGEMVRQLPACRHLFHVDCVDAWLCAHRTCPLCRCLLSPPNVVDAKGAAALVVASVAELSSVVDDALLPPV